MPSLWSKCCVKFATSPRLCFENINVLPIGRKSSMPKNSPGHLPGRSLVTNNSEPLLWSFWSANTGLFCPKSFEDFRRAPGPGYERCRMMLEPSFGTFSDVGPAHKAPPPVATQLVVPTELSDTPVTLTCYHCQHHVTTHTKTGPSTLSWMLCGCLCIFLWVM